MDLTNNVEVLNFPFSDILPGKKFQPVKYYLPRTSTSRNIKIKKL